MIRNVTWAALVAAGLTTVLAGCSHPPLPPPAPPVHRVSVTATAMVEAIRAAREDDTSVLEVTPLRNPSVNGFLDGAHADENMGKYRDALAKVDEALKLSPDAPDILQFRAEIEILLRDFPAADADARRSYVLGAKLGGLCASNWQTVLEIAQADDNEAGVAEARTARDACHKSGPVRL